MKISRRIIGKKQTEADIAIGKFVFMIIVVIIFLGVLFTASYFIIGEQKCEDYIKYVTIKDLPARCAILINNK